MSNYFPFFFFFCVFLPDTFGSLLYVIIFSYLDIVILLHNCDEICEKNVLWMESCLIWDFNAVMPLREECPIQTLVRYDRTNTLH